MKNLPPIMGGRLAPLPSIQTNSASERSPGRSESAGTPTTLTPVNPEPILEVRTRRGLSDPTSRLIPTPPMGNIRVHSATPPPLPLATFGSTSPPTMMLPRTSSSGSLPRSGDPSPTSEGGGYGGLHRISSLGDVMDVSGARASRGSSGSGKSISVRFTPTEVDNYLNATSSSSSGGVSSNAHLSTVSSLAPPIVIPTTFSHRKSTGKKYDPMMVNILAEEETPEVASSGSTRTTPDSGRNANDRLISPTSPTRLGSHGSSGYLARVPSITALPEDNVLDVSASPTTSATETYSFGKMSRFGSKRGLSATASITGLSFVSTSSVGAASRAGSSAFGGSALNINFMSIDLAKIEAEVESAKEKEMEDKNKSKMSPTDFLLDFQSKGDFKVNEDLTIGEDGIRTSSGVVSPGTSKISRDDLIFIEELGRGASATVHKAIHKGTLKLVACKEIQVRDESKRSQLVKEIKALQSHMVALDPSNAPSPKSSQAIEGIVRMHEAYSTPSVTLVTVVLEYMDGGSLNDLIIGQMPTSENPHPQRGIFDELWLARISKQLLQALDALHKRNIIHRDIKPANILINRKGDAKLSDFGIIKDNESDDHGPIFDGAETFVGTLNYMSPERVQSKKYSSKADIWSLGLALYSVFTGESAIPKNVGGYWGVLAYFQTLITEGKELPIDFTDVSDELQSFFRDMLALDPDFRSSAATLLEHPFIVNNHDDEGYPFITEDDPFSCDDEVSRKSLKRKFRKICKAIYYDYVKKAKKEIKASRPFTLPIFRAKHIRGLASQVGVENDYAQKTFQKLIDKINKKVFVMKKDAKEKDRCSAEGGLKEEVDAREDEDDEDEEEEEEEAVEEEEGEEEH